MSKRTLEIGLAFAALAAGVLVAFSTLGRGVWLDEFWTLSATAPGQSAAQFWAAMSKDVHPILHYGLIYLAQGYGLGEVIGLRALGLLGLPLVLGAGWFAHRRGALSLEQACVLAALATSSSMFLDTLADMRAYFLLFCASIATTLIWRVLMQRAQRGEGPGAAALAWWGVCLAVFVNLHYFATLFGGLLTAALLLAARRKGTTSIGLISALAAAPALALLAAQVLNMDAGIVAWIQTGRIDAIYMTLDSVWAAAGQNCVAIACAVTALLIVAERRQDAPALRDELTLLVLIALYAALLILVNAARPIITERYLIGVGGAITVLLALLAANPRAPKWAVAAICVFALLVQFRAWHSDRFIRPGWSASAAAVADILASCPSARIFIDPSLDSPEIVDFVAARRLGQTYYARLYGFETEEVGPGGIIPSPGVCPNVLWLEHLIPAPGNNAADILDRIDVGVSGAAELLPVGSGSLIVVH